VQLFDLAVEEDAIVLSCHPGQAPASMQAIDMYLFTDDVQLADAGAFHPAVRCHRRI